MHKNIILLTMTLGWTLGINAQVKTSDSLFVKKSRPIPFVVNKINISDRDRRWITDSLIPQLAALGDSGIVIGRATASPEGNTENNTLLAYHRKEAVDRLLSAYGINTDRIYYDVVSEDYPLLLTMMQMSHDKQLPVVERLMRQHQGNDKQLKLALQKYNYGHLWQYILRRYFPRLRAVRIMAINRNLVEADKMVHTEKKAEVEPIPRPGVKPLPIPEPQPQPEPLPKPEPQPQPEPEPEPYQMEHVVLPRRELLSIKTNLLFDFAYMPGYDRFCPIPNVALEYYPLHGHLTYGASFDGPWWQHYDDHKYFQLRNYQLHTRYYLRRGDIELHRPGEGAAFKGMFFSAYAHANLFNICFGEKRGWEGEGWGAGLGLGYVLPLGKQEHWRLEFALQAGYYITKYDPYQWLCPVDPDKDQELYYYKWYGDAKDFKKRQHRYTWLGPTRIEITLSYDLLYRRRHKQDGSNQKKNGTSFRSSELSDYLMIKKK